MMQSTSGLILLTSSAIFAQSSQTPAFEVATIKLAASSPVGGRTSSSGKTVIYNNTTLLNALGRAFGITSANQIVGPAWVFENRDDIVAMAPDNTPTPAGEMPRPHGGGQSPSFRKDHAIE